MSVAFLVAVKKYLNEVRQEGLLWAPSLWVQSFTMGEGRNGRWQRCEEAGYSASIVRKQTAMDVGAQLTFSFFNQPETPVHGMVLLPFRVGLLM